MPRSQVLIFFQNLYFLCPDFNFFFLLLFNRIVVLIDKVNAELVDTGKKVNLSVYSFEQVENLGKENPRDAIPPKPEDLAILMYTSGTTSRPKGVMMSHGNVAAVLAGVNDVIPNFSHKDRFFSYLPLAHILERAAEAAMIYQGASIGFFRGVSIFY